MSQSQNSGQEVIKTKVDGQIQKCTSEEIEESLRLIEDVKFFLATAPANWQENQIIRRYYLNNDQGFVSCVFWNNLYYITGTDIVKCCVYRMQKFGREVLDRKKFEEGIFSDLRHLKCGVDATLETPKSEFLSFLFKNMCLKTQKKQKVFFWFSVPHDKLFADALERDMKRHAASQLPTTRSVSEPALSFTYDDRSGLSLYDQLLQHMDLQRIKRSNASTVESTTETQPTTNFVQVQTSTGAEESSPVHIKNEALDLEDTPDELTSKYAPQELIINPPAGSPDELDLDSAAEVPGLSKDPGEEDDFPLDYFPVEVEYPNQQSLKPGIGSMYYDNEFETSYIPLSAVPPVSAGFYENSHFPEEVTFGPPPVTSAARLAFQIPPPPMSAARSQFMTNGEYYASYVKGQEDRIGDRLSQELDQDKEYQEEVVDNSRDFDRNPKQYISYQKPGADSRSINGVLPPGSIYPNRYAYPSMDIQQGTLDPHMTRSYAMEDYLCDNSALYDAFPGGAYVPPSSKPYTPGYRLTPMAPSTPFVGVTQYGNRQVLTTTAKNYPINPYYQSSPSFQRWGNVHGYLRGFPSIQATSAPQGPSMPMQHPHSASKLYFNKPNIVHKPSPRAPKQRTRAKKPPSLSRSVRSHHRTNCKNDLEQGSATFSMPTPESNSTTLNDARNKRPQGQKQYEADSDNYKDSFAKDQDQKVFYK